MRSIRPAAFTSVLVAAGIRISMDGRGRWMDNVFIERLWRSLKYEDVYLKGYAREARAGIGSWIAFYNGRRPRQALDDRPPMAVWRAGVTGPICPNAVDMMDNVRALPTPTAATTKASHALRSVIEGNQEQPAFPIKNPDSWSYSTGPPQHSTPSPFAPTSIEAGASRLRLGIAKASGPDFCALQPGMHPSCVSQPVAV
jgi:Integrase core domain